MKLIKKINSKIGLFVCSYCNKKIEVEFGNGFRNKSCGCKQRFFQSINQPLFKHGERKTRLYTIWKNMRQRCNNTKCYLFCRYGSRGISICEDWGVFICFKNWAINNGYKDDLQIDRKDNDGNYEPSNCRWVTAKIQSRNKRNVYITFEKAQEVRQKYIPRKYTRKKLAEEYMVKESVIKGIIENRTWLVA